MRDKKSRRKRKSTLFVVGLSLVSFFASQLNPVALAFTSNAASAEPLPLNPEIFRSQTDWNKNDFGALHTEITSRIKYDQEKHTVTFEENDQVFQVYRLTEKNKVGNLLRFGFTETVLENGLPQPRKIVVELVHLQIRGESVPVYAFTIPDAPEYLLVRERLPQGGIGRVLRIRDVNSQGRVVVDQEYFYEAATAVETETVTVLDNLKGTFVSMQLVEKDNSNSNGLIDNPKRQLSPDVLMKGLHHELKVALGDHVTGLIAAPKSGPVFAALYDFDKREGWIHDERGPPARASHPFELDSHLDSNPSFGFRPLSFLFIVFLLLFPSDPSSFGGAL